MNVALAPRPAFSEVPRCDGAALTALECSFRGELIRPESPSYDERRRVWNGSIDRYPALIARCTGVADVVAAVVFARRTGLPLAVRSGGHSFAGLSVCDGGLVIDLGPMKRIGSTRTRARCRRRPASSSGSWTLRPRRSAWPCRAVR